MGKQYNKTEKKRRRVRYQERLKEKAKSAAAANKPKVARKSPAKKKDGTEAAPAAAE